MDIRIAAGIVLAFGLSANAQTISVHGKVTDAAGKPLANAVVELTHAKLKDTTGIDGAYALGAGIIAVRPIGNPFADGSVNPSAADMRLDQGALMLAVAEDAPIRIGVFDLRGNLLERTVLDRAKAGSYRLNLAGRFPADNLLIVKASIGGRAKAFAYFPLGRSAGADADLEYLGPSSAVLAKEAAFVDTLKATAAGYQAKSFALNSYAVTQDILLEANASCTAPTPPTAKDAVTLDMAATEGPPTYSASGFIYGIAADGLQPPDSLLSAIKVKTFRAGRGTSGGCGEVNWKIHWAVMKAYYAKAKAMGGTMLMLMSDDYQYSCSLPGDGGDWTTFDAFLDQLIDSVKANGMTGPDVRWELWNESDYAPTFWSGTQAQWLDTWKHEYQHVRAALPSAVIEGPSFATGSAGSSMSAFLDYAKTNNVVPDILNWHEAGGGSDPQADLATATRGLSTRGITGVKGFDINEYGSKAEQNPGHSAWFLARFDRAGLQGLRSNWAGGATFFSNMGDLVTTNWQPNSQYWIYKRYADQTGLRINTTAGTQVDAVGYADMAAAKSIIVVGNRGGSTGSVNVVIKNVPSWLQSGGTTKVLVEKMLTGTGASSGPTVVSNASVAVTCNTVIVTLDWATATDGYALTLSPN
ncbi:MAG: hypothetical protein JF616_11975 [Fibrobacteres bacterium]|nr:hypothetical protein [Fibrobacterota bacterium]